MFGISRETFYKYKSRFDQFGLLGLKEKERISPKMPNQTKPELEDKIVRYCINHPTFGPLRVSNELKKEGHKISPSGVYNILKRHGLNRRYDRLLALEKQSIANGIILSSEQFQALERLRPKARHIHAPFAGYLFNQDTFYIGHLKGIGKMYAQVGIDCYSSFGFARIYTHKTAQMAVDFLKEHVLPIYQLFQIPLFNILTDNGKEYTTHWSSKNLVHCYEILLNKLNISHRYIRPRTPRTNGFVERFNRTLLDEFFKPAFLKKVYTSIQQLQSDLDDYLVYYNTQRTHQGRNLNGKIPMQQYCDCVRPKLLVA